jgi:hypothetical protein
VIGEVAGAALLHGLVAVGLGLLGARVAQRARHPVPHWLWEHLYLPMLRAAALALFVLVAYPALYGVEEAPPVGALLAAGPGRLSQLVGVVFLLSLVLPLAPGVGNPAFALPVQGAAGAALVAGWLAQAGGSPGPGLWPGAGVLALAAALAYLAHWVARRVAGAIEVTGRQLWAVADAGEAAVQALLLFLQVPALLVYSLGLGRQL